MQRWKFADLGKECFCPSRTVNLAHLVRRVRTFPIKGVNILERVTRRSPRLGFRLKSRVDTFKVFWRRELVPRLDAAATAHISGVFAPLRHADTVVISYAPGKGTTVRVNSSITASAAHHDLMLAFLDHWLGQRPLSESLKRALLKLP